MGKYGLPADELLMCPLSLKANVNSIELIVERTVIVGDGRK